jgi:hypothetical protein
MECEALGKQAWCGVCDHWRRLVEAYRLDVFHAATHWVGRCSSTKRAAAGWGGKSLLIRATIASQVRVCTARANPLSIFALIAQVLTQVGKKTLANTTRGDLGVE